MSRIEADEREGAVTVGRPRDPDVSQRILRAAVRLFGATGWSGFTFDAVAREAGVGKAAIYRRWHTKNALLLDSLSTHLDVRHDADTGDVRQDLIALASQLMSSYLDDAGAAFMRLAVEAQSVDAVDDRYRLWSESQKRAAREIVRRAIIRGELPEGTSATLIMDTICGGAINHVTSTPPELRDEVRAGMGSYAQRLVDFVLTPERAS